jgi:hypothetical protein
MPEKKTLERAKRDLRQGKSPTTAAGEFVREEIEHVRHGKHGVRSTKQAIAIGLSKARRAGVPLAPPRKGTASRRTRKAARRDVQVGKKKHKPRTSRTRSVATVRALKREPRSPVSRRALAKHARQAAARRKKRGATTRSPARKAKRSTKKRAR